MASLKISEVLNRLGRKSLRELSRKRNLEGRREKSDSLASRLAKSYKGDFESLLKDLTREDLKRIFSQPIRIGRVRCELRNKSQHNLSDFQRFAHQAFVDGVVAKEFNVLEEPLAKSLKELEAILRENGNSLKNEDLSYRDLSGFNFSGCHLISIDFSYSILRGAIFDSATLSDVQMVAADIYGSSWKSATLIDVSLGDVSTVFDAIGDRNSAEGIQVKFGSNNCENDYSNLNLNRSSFSGRLYEPNFENCDLTNATLKIEYCGGITFDHAILENTKAIKLESEGEGEDSYCNATFKSTSLFQNQDFTEADFSNASFIEINLSKARFRDCNFTNTKFIDCDFDDVDFNNIHFKGIDFSSQTFSQTIFKDCSFTDCDFSECEMPGSQFNACEATNSAFRNAEMEGVIISQDSLFEGCDFSGARLTKAEIEDIYRSQPFAFIGAIIL